MGSTLSIVNNTADEWHCRVSVDVKALQMVKVIIAAIASAGLALVTVGLGAVAQGAVIATITRNSHAVSSVPVDGNVAVNFAGSIMDGVRDILNNDGYVTIPAGQTHAFGPMMLSLWQMGTCVRLEAVDATSLHTETVYMRPIFSGATHNSTRLHDIQYWINKNGIETHGVVNSNASASH